MPDITNEDYAKLKDEFDALKEKYDILDEKIKGYDSTIAEKDERIKNLNDALYKATFTRKPEKETPTIQDDNKDFADLYLETLSEMKNKR